MQKKLKKKGLRRFLAVALPFVLAASILVACSREVVFTTGFGKDEVFRIGDESCSVSEVMVYLTAMQNQYEEVYGEEIWEISQDGTTLEESVKETILAQIAQIKTMCLLAEEKGISLDAEALENVSLAAEEYYASLSETERGLLDVDGVTIEKLYREYTLANLVYQEIIDGVNPEISDDEARTIVVQHILLRTDSQSGSGSREDYADDLKEAVYEKACEIRAMALEEGQDFTELASKYSEDTTITYSFGKGEMEEAFEEAAFALETGEISEVVETSAGFHIIKCISTFDREQTDLNKLTIVEERRKEVFGEEYNAFVETLVRQLNEELWSEVHLIHDEALQTSSFFEIYAKYFGDNAL